jgi:hypothetical protein
VTSKYNSENDKESKPRPSKSSFSTKNNQKNDSIECALLTFPEWAILKRTTAIHKSLIQTRAVELGFYPHSLTEKQKNAAFLCLSFKELQPIFENNAIREKNFRLQKNLSDMEKIIVKKYCLLTFLMANSTPLFYDPLVRKVRRMGEKERELCVSDYFRIMRFHGERVFEKPFWFSSKSKKGVTRDGGVLEPFILEETGDFCMSKNGGDKIE